MNTVSEPLIRAEATTIYSALDVSNSRWILAIGHRTEKGVLCLLLVDPECDLSKITQCHGVMVQML